MSSVTEVEFFPVVHLLTGPPGLGRNGGVWKLVKRHLSEVSDAPRLMVQCLHFTSYNLSLGAWDDWFEPYYSSTRLARELKETFGDKRDVFVDSGGFQLLYADKMDLSKWHLEVNPKDILELQAKYRPQRIASLDSPFGPKVGATDAAKLRQVSIDNAVWLAKHSDSLGFKTTPYLVTHGRTPTEVQEYVAALAEALPAGWLKRNEYGIALGSQVPLTGQPKAILENARAVLSWMDKACTPDAPLHVFGIGEGVAGQLTAHAAGRRLSFDNSSWIQKAFRMRMFDPASATYQEFNPAKRPDCECGACKRLEKLGDGFVSDLMTRPAYRPAHGEAGQVNRSDILALVGLHNLDSWRHRLEIPPPRLSRPAVAPTAASAEASTTYEFPLRGFKPKAKNLLLLACSKHRPYRMSRSHRNVLTELEAAGLREGKDFDRITLSGLYGPVHWTHEDHPAIRGYDFPLSRLVSESHKSLLKLRTANVFNVIRKKYAASVAHLPQKPYQAVFGPVVEAFAGQVSDEAEKIPDLLVPTS